VGAAVDATWMARALALAERARPLASPNPHVGCVLVRDGQVVAEGWTQRPGGHHAEAMALARTDDAAGTTAYVTLEPCAHTGRTPPCADALARAGVARVVMAVADPHPLATGGTAILRRAGVEVTEGVLAAWAGRQLAGFLVAARRGRPHVTLKLAQTVDGSLTNPAGRWVTGPAARRAVHRLRARVDGVLVGSGTVLADDPRLDVRDAPSRREAAPRPVVLDARGRTPPSATIARPGTILVTAAGRRDWEVAMVERGVAVARVAPADGGGVDLHEALRLLHEAFGLQTLLAEPGATLAGALMDADVVDRVVRHVASSVQATDGRARIVAPVAASARWPLALWARRDADEEVVVDRPTRT
jgi:diaminohydroxyphosphoribosylaminopyrimidine deaminase/5-amino-6-(5-phosphoribosylamino)uracil reductase